jgi:6-pyruvoyltetrahydropterin/6-carboxytetrahydropterin synthase
MSQASHSGVFTIGKTFSFEAGHALPSLGPEHKCSRRHGHSYHVEVVWTAGKLSGPGFVADFADLAPFGQYLKDQLDHRMLNEVLDFEPTSERLAQHFAEWLQDVLEPVVEGWLKAVRVSETASSWAQFEVEEA